MGAACGAESAPQKTEKAAPAAVSASPPPATVSSAPPPAAKQEQKPLMAKLEEKQTFPISVVDPDAAEGRVKRPRRPARCFAVAVIT